MIGLDAGRSRGEADVPSIDRRSLIRRAAAVGALAWAAPVIIESVVSPAGAITGGAAPPLTSGPCRTVASQTEVQYSAPSGYVFVARGLSTSCPASVSLSSITPTTTVTLSFPKQTLHHVFLVVESVPAGECVLYVYAVESPHSNGDPCYLNDLVGSAQCNPAVSGSPCSPLSRAEP